MQICTPRGSCSASEDWRWREKKMSLDAGCDGSHSNAGRRGCRLRGEFVDRLFKLAAATLALVLFGTPVVALVDCSPNAAMVRHCGGDDCPMMRARQQSGTQVSQAPSGDGSCCQISNLPPSNQQPAMTTVSRTLLSMPGSQGIVLSAAVPILAAGQGPPVQSLLAVGPTPQAVLCTFLI